MLARSEKWILDRLELLAWPQCLMMAVHHGKLSVAAAKNLAKIDKPEVQEMYVDYAVDSGATARTTAAWLQSYKMGIVEEDPTEIEPEEGPKALPPVVPYTPCVICGEKYEMAKLRYTPVCAECGGVLVDIARELRHERSGATRNINLNHS